MSYIIRRALQYYCDLHNTSEMGNMTSASVSDSKKLEDEFDISVRGFFPATEPLRHCAKIPNFEAVVGNLPDINERKSKAELLAIREPGQGCNMSISRGFCENES